MARLTVSNTRVRERSATSISIKLQESFGSTLPEILKTVSAISVNKQVKNDLLLQLIAGESRPMNGKYWPTSWCKSTKRTLSYFSNLEDVYWTAMKVITIEEVDKLTTDWNALSASTSSYLLRKIGKPIKMSKIYTTDRWQKDIYVCTYSQKKGIGLEQLIKNFSDRLHTDIIYPYCWKTSRIEIEQENKLKETSNIKIIQVGKK